MEGQNYQQSAVMGGQGGIKQQFIQPNITLVAVRGKVGDNFDNIQFLFMDIKTGNYIQSPKWGYSKGGQQFHYQAPPGQWIDKIYGSYGIYMNSLRFGTNGGDRSKQFGRVREQQGSYIAQGRRINGVKIGAGAVVDRLQFVSTE